jgi:hypothetical protein
MNEAGVNVTLLRLVAERLERLPADSRWAHRASGVRGQLLRSLDQLDSGEKVSVATLQGLTETGLDILRAAAMELV